MVNHFGVWDFAVLITVLLVFALIGIYYRYTGGRQKTTKEYLMADRSMSVFPVSFSLVASFMSAISLLGVSNESYQFGAIFVLINVAYLINTPIIAYIFLPVFYRMRTTSVYEYLERRYGHTTRLVASIAYSTQMILYMGIVLYAPALALEAVTGLNRQTAMLLIGFVCTFYATIGGMKAVLITEVLQALLMFSAIYSVIIVAAIKAGGLTPIWQNAVESGRFNFNSFSLDPTVRHTWWSLIIGGMVVHLSLYGVNQTQVQRMLSVRSMKGARAAIGWSTPILCFLSLSTIFSGLSMLYFYRDCDPALAGRIKSRDQLMPLFAIDTMGQYPGLCGLFVSGIFGASISSCASAISSLSAVTIEDYIKPLYAKCFKRPMLDEHSILPSKVAACVYGIICILLAFAASNLGGVLQASLTIFGVVGGPLLAVFTLGMLTTRSNQRGVLLGFFCGLGFAFVLGFGGPKPVPQSLSLNVDGCAGTGNSTILQPILMATAANDEYFWLFRLSYLWYSVIGFLITAFVGYVGSILLAYMKWANNDQIYLDLAHSRYDCDLFAEPLARKLRNLQPNEETTKLNSGVDFTKSANITILIKHFLSFPPHFFYYLN